MIKVYAVALGIGFIALLVVVMGGALAENLDRADRDPGVRLGSPGRLAIGAILGFGMAGLAAEFSPLDLTTAVGVIVAIAGGALGAIWVRYSSGTATDG